MKLDGVLFLAARTARSRAYAQAMAAHGLEPQKVLLYGTEKAGRPGQGSADVAPGSELNRSLFIPDLSLPVEQTGADQDWNLSIVESDSLNSPEMVQQLQADSPGLVIFSGYGGEIVSEDVLGLGAPFLHVHSGWLPDYRGSTTIYYSILQERNCSASALLLAKDIDAGPVIARATYPLPPADVDIDYVYDSAIRADLLVKVLDQYAENGFWDDIKGQVADEGRDYYVIHPVLKHLAMLSIGNR